MLERVAQFTILDKLGQGGMGVVFRAQDTKLRRQVALKLLPSEHVGDVAWRARFLREARSAAAVTHANIATIYEVGEDEVGRVYIAMELVEGRSLRAELASRGRLDAAEALRIARQIARGLAKAHEVGLIHRDVKPDNVMLTPEREVKVLDFGLAKAREPSSPSVLEAAVTGEIEASQVTAKGVIVGTPGYLSPEQSTGKAVDARSDVFSLGVVLYEMIAGELPFRGATFGELLVAVARDAPRPIAELVPDLPAPVAALITRCLAKDPELRPSSGRELVEAIDAATAGGTSLAFARTERVAVSDPPPAPPRRRVEVARGTLARVALGLVGAVVVGGGLYLAGARKPPPVTAAPAGRDAGVGLLDLPPASCNEAAAREYRTALEVSRGRGMEFGHEHFERAIEADPSCAEAYLRAAIHSSWGPSARERYNRASLLRDRLTPRDRELLDAFEPFWGHDPPDFDTMAKRVVALPQHHPNDAELLVVLGYMLWASDPQHELASVAQRAIDIDPGFSAAWHLLGTARQRDGDYDGAAKAFDDCAKAAPASVECVYGQVQLAQWVGRCTDMERHARTLIARSSGDKDAYGPLAHALASAGGQREAIAEALRQWASGVKPERAAIVKVEEARLAILFGDFERAESLLGEADRALEGSQNRTRHAIRAQQAFELYLETDRADAALKTAEDFAARHRAWGGQLEEFFGSGQEGMLLVPRMLGIQHRRGKITRAKRDAELAAWFEHEVSVHDARMRWLLTQAAWVETPAEAEAAVAAFPRDCADCGRVPMRAFPNAISGHVLALGGRLDEGIDELRKVTQRCEALDAPLAHTQAHLWLGEALEAKGANAEACAAYEVVLARWRNARPPSRSAKKALERVNALACARSRAVGSEN